MFWWWEKGHCVIVEQIEHPSEVWNYLYQTQINLNTDRNFPKSLTLNLPVHSHNPTHPYQADIMLSVTHTYNVILLTLHTKITHSENQGKRWNVRVSEQLWAAHVPTDSALMWWRVANQRKEMLPFIACGGDRLTSNGKLCQQVHFFQCLSRC